MNRLVPTLITAASLALTALRTAEAEPLTKEAVQSQIEKITVPGLLETKDLIAGYYSVRLESATQRLKETLKELVASCDSKKPLVIEANAFGLYLNAKRYQRICDDAKSKDHWESNKLVIKQALAYASQALPANDAQRPRVHQTLERYLSSIDEPAERMR